MRTLGLIALVAPLALVVDGCECEDCGGFPLPVHTAYLRLTVEDSTGTGVSGVRVMATSSQNSVSIDSTNGSGIAFVTQHMYSAAESVTVALTPPGPFIPRQLRVRLQDSDTTAITTPLGTH